MNSHSVAKSRTQTLPVLAVLVTMALFIAAVHFTRQPNAQERYKTCSLLAAHDPAKALEFVQPWLGKNADSPIARHCEALAWFGLKDYGKAADMLEALAKEPAARKSKLAASLLTQAATARRAAGDELMAVQDEDNAQALEGVGGGR